MTILVIDDTEEVREILGAILEEDGYADVIMLDSASAAFSLLALDDPDAPPASIDLILLDITMPVVDGIEACRRIRSDPRYADVPIVMTTGRADISSVSASLACGATDYLTKPLKAIDLLACVRSKLKLKAELDRRNERERYLEQYVPFF